MANFKKRITGYNKMVLDKTQIDKCGNNYVIFSIDTDNNNINYIISRHNIKQFYKKILPLYKDNETIDIKEVILLLQDDIYSIYNTKVSQKRIPQILLNLLIINKLIKSDDGIDFLILKNATHLDNFINTL